MRYNRLDLNLLAVLDALFAEMNVARAAERVNLSPSAMSSALARLREQFGDDLVVQVGRRLVRTPLGDDLVQPVREVLLQVDATIISRPTFDPAESTRVFRVAMSEFTLRVLMPRVLRRAALDAPQVRFELVSSQGSDPKALVDRAQIDLLVIPEPYLLAEHPSDRLFTANYVCVVCERNPDISDAMSVDQYLSLPHVAQRDTQAGIEQIPALERWLLSCFGNRRVIEVYTSSFFMPAALVVGTRRIATVHTQVAADALKLHPVRVIPAPLEFPTLVQCMQWHRSKMGDPGLHWLRKLMIEESASV